MGVRIGQLHIEECLLLSTSPPSFHAPCSDLHSLVRLIQHSFFFKPCADIKISSAKFMILGKDVCKV